MYVRWSNKMNCTPINLKRSSFASNFYLALYCNIFRLGKSEINKKIGFWVWKVACVRDSTKVIQVCFFAKRETLMLGALQLTILIHITSSDPCQIFMKFCDTFEFFSTNFANLFLLNIHFSILHTYFSRIIIIGNELRFLRIH